MGDMDSVTKITKNVPEDNNKSKKPLELFDLPELPQKIILSNLDLLDLMSVRLSCKTLNSWVTSQNYDVSPKLQYPVCIKICEAGSNSPESEASWKYLLQPGTMIYRTKIHKLKLEVDTESFYDDPELHAFLQIYGSSIRKLKLNQFWVNSQGQIKFIESLTKLQMLKIDRIRISRRDTEYLFPKNLEELEELKLGEIQIINLKKDKDYPYILMNKCSNLQALRLPKLISGQKFSREENERRFRFLGDFCVEQENKFGEKKLAKVNLKNINSPIDISRSQFGFMLFLKFASIVRVHVEFTGVSVGLFEQLMLEEELDQELAFATEFLIQGVRGFNVDILSTLPLDLRSITIPSVNQEIGHHFGTYFPIMEYNWEFLESIRIHYDVQEQDLSQPFLRDMAEFLFGNEEINRTDCMEEISISFAPHLLNVTIPAAVFSARQITTYCYTISKLELINWNPGNKSFIRLWKGLPFLLTLIIKNCPSLGNVGFIGEDVNKPAFLGIPFLKKLTLQLDLMPKVTERAFKDVFRHMKLEEFILISEKPLKNIGANAINWLLDGPFSTKIRKFPFHTWSSTSISPAQMVELKAQFKNLLY